ncbi:hypothetical protein ACPJHQ_23765 [Rossellomorea sp. H39__3]
METALNRKNELTSPLAWGKQPANPSCQLTRQVNFRLTEDGIIIRACSW